MGGSVSSDRITDSTKLAQHGGQIQNVSLSTSNGVDFHPREIGTPWHPQHLGVGKILGLQGRTLTNTSHRNLGMESFNYMPKVERTAVNAVHTPPSGQVLPPGPVDANADFSGLRAEIVGNMPSFGRGAGVNGRATPGGGTYGASKGRSGNGLASADIRDLMKNKRNYTGWARHGGIDPANGVMQMSIPPFYEKVPRQKMSLKQQYPKTISTATAQGFFEN